MDFEEATGHSVNFMKRIAVTFLFCVLSASELGQSAVRGGSLDGEWEFRTNAEASWRTAQVPMPIQAQFEDLRDFSGVAWYRKRFSSPRFSRKKANGTAEVWRGGLQGGGVD